MTLDRLKGGERKKGIKSVSFWYDQEKKDVWIGYDRNEFNNGICNGRVGEVERRSADEKKDEKRRKRERREKKREEKKTREEKRRRRVKRRRREKRKRVKKRERGREKEGER